MGETQEIIVDTAVLSLFVVLFLVISRNRRDLRLMCWVGGWFWIVLNFVAEIGLANLPEWRSALTCVSVDTLALGAVTFAVSTMIQKEGKRQGLQLFFGLSVGTLLCLDVAVFGEHELWELAGLLVLRQMVAISLAARKRRSNPGAGWAIGVLGTVTGAVMVYGVLHGHPEVVLAVMPCEMYLVVAIDFWANGWQRTKALKMMIGGLVAWAAVFPVKYALLSAWPGFAVDREVWNLPKFFAAVGMILVVIEEDMRAAQMLNADYRRLFDSNPHGLWIIDVETLRVLAVNQAALNMHGFSREEFVSRQITELIHPDMRELAVTQLRSETPQANRASRHLRKDGSVIALDLTAYDIRFEGRHCRFVMAVDATEREALEQELDRQIHYDQLTGLPNRMSFPDLLARAVQQALPVNEKLAVLSLDFDRFKHLNEMYGLRVADEYIQRVAEVLTTRMRAMDIVARTAGDEFTIVLTGLKSRDTAEQAVRELVEIFHSPLLVQGYKVQRTVSIGGVIAPDNGEDPIAIWRGAENARTQAKIRGGDCAVWLSDELYTATEERRMLEEYMRNHLADGGFYLMYQPLYGQDGKVYGLEALLRLTHPTLGAISPVRVVPIAEESGLIVALGHWALEEVCRQQLKWKAEGMEPVPVAVNVSVLQLMHEDFAQALMATLDRYGVDARLVHLEVTESVAMQNVAEVSEHMATLAELGIHFSIDDFGTGHSSLARLGQLATSELKIDRSFLEPACMGTSHSIVQAIITMAHALGHVVVAEGVETEVQLNCLRELHCDLYQGFLLSKPVLAAQIPELAARAHPLLAENRGPLWQETPRPRLIGRG